MKFCVCVSWFKRGSPALVVGCGASPLLFDVGLEVLQCALSCDGEGFDVGDEGEA